MSVSHNHKAHQLPGKPAALKHKPKLELDRIIGNTILSNSGLAINAQTGEVAYTAGCVIVIYNPKQNKQVKFLMGKKNKAIGSLCFSPNGKYLAAGEVGYQPSVLVFELATKQLAHELKGHKFGVSCLQFSPNNKLLCSVGFEHDGLVNVWEWRSNTLICGSKVTAKVHAVSFAEDNSYFVTAGNKHIKFWYLDAAAGSKSAPGTKAKLAESKSAILGSHKDSDYFDVACGRGSNSNLVFTVNDKGHLCIINPVTRIMEKWIDMRTNGKVRAVSVNDKFIACGCNDGVIRLFSPDKLEYIATVPKPNPLGQDVKILDEKGDSHEKASSLEKIYPDTIACKLNEDGTKLIAVYSNRSLFIWDIKDPAKVPKYRSFLAHSGCIWDIALPPVQNAALPAGTFVTCSADHSIRFWNVDPTHNNKNVYSKEMIQSIPVVNESKELKHEHQLESIHVGDGGLRCISFNYDGQRIASGDRNGNLRVHSVDSQKCVSFTEAHDAEILSLDYARVNGKDLLASGSRDRLIHVFENDPSNAEYKLFSTLDEHSASITSIRFAQSGSKILSSGADKSITFSKRQDDQFVRYHVTTVHGTIYDTQLDPSEKLLITAGQEKKLNIYDISSSKLVKSVKTDPESDEIVRIELDPSGQFLAASSQDRHIRVYHLESGEMCTNVSGHSELVTGLKFSSDCNHLISVSGDGCIFLWRWPEEFAESLRTSAAAIKPARAMKADPRTVLNNSSALPAWAKKALGESVDTSSEHISLLHPSGEWAKRTGDLTIGNNVYKLDDSHKLPLESSEAKPEQSASTSVSEPKQQPHAEPAEEEAVFLEDDGAKEVSQQQFEVTATQQPTPHVVPHSAHGSHSAHSSNHSTPVVPHKEHAKVDDHSSLHQSKDAAESDVIENINFEEDLNSFAEFMHGPTKLMKSNFENLTEKFLPTQKVDSTRLSLSSKHLNHVTKQLAKERQQGKSSPVKATKHDAENASENVTPVNTNDETQKAEQSTAVKTEDRSDLEKIKERKEQLAREVERTRVRLEQLGALIKHPAPGPSQEDAAQTTVPVESAQQDAQNDTHNDTQNDTSAGIDEDEVVNVDDINGEEVYDEDGEEPYDEFREYDQALFNLQSSFRDAIRVFRRLQQQQFETGDADTATMVDRYYDAFGDMKLTLNSVVLDDGAVNLQSTLLERYSELLLATVREKMVNGGAPTNTVVNNESIEASPPQAQNPTDK